MGIFFNPAEIFDVAMGIEKNGINFYTQATKNSKNNDVKALYDFLIGEEKTHLQFFQKSKVTLENAASPDILDEAYGLYIKALIESIVFTPEKSAEAINIARSGHESQVLSLALDMERDSILFYLEMKPLMSRGSKGTMDKIIKEERSHLERLSAMKEKLGHI